MRASLRISGDKENMRGEAFKRKSLSNLREQRDNNIENNNLLVNSPNMLKNMNTLNLLSLQQHTNQSINMHAKLEELTLQHDSLRK